MVEMGDPESVERVHFNLNGREIFGSSLSIGYVFSTLPILNNYF